jgi:hypothetical protein
MELIYEKTNIYTQEDIECVNGLKKKVARTYEKIPKTAQRGELTAT